MPNSPANPHTATTQKRARKAIVLLAPGSLFSAAEENEIDYLQVIEVRRSAGGRRLDQAILQYDLARFGKRIENLKTPTGMGVELQIRVADESGEGSIAVFCGELLEQSVSISPDGETATIVASIEPYHFGELLLGIPVWNVVMNEEMLIDDDPIFNPYVDGIQQTNRDVTHTHGGDFDYDLFIDPESIRTDAARNEQEQLDFGDEADGWDMHRAIYTLQGICNENQTFIKRASNTNSLFPGPFEGAPPPHNIRLRRGRYLPEYLDAVLNPHGYDWFVKNEIVEDEESGDQTFERRIRFFKRGGDPARIEPKKIYLQAIGEELDLALTNASESSVTTNIADIANEVIGQGSFVERQITIELQRTWSVSDDATDLQDLQISNPLSDFHTTKQKVWRKWIGNEAGDIDPSEVGRTVQLPSFTEAFGEGNWVRRRRRIGRCLQFDETEKRAAPIVEWMSPYTNQWEEIPPEWACTILDDQIGVYFSGDTPPLELVNAGANARIRITGTIKGDKRVQSTATRRNTSPNINTIKLFIDLSDRFHDRQVVTTGTLASQPATGGNGSDEQQNGEEMRTYLEELQDIEDSAAIQAEFTLFGLHFEYEIGDSIESIAGRDISLNRNAEEREDKKYPQITAIRHLWQQQRTVLTLDTFDQVIEWPEILPKQGAKTHI